MTELTFLVELLLNHKLQKSTRDIIASRLKEVEEGFRSPSYVISPTITTQNAVMGQAPSTMAAMARHAGVPVTNTIHAPDLPPVAIVAQTPAAVQAMNSRQQAISESMAGKVDKTTGRPRKF